MIRLGLASLFLIIAGGCSISPNLVSHRVFNSKLLTQAITIKLVTFNIQDTYVVGKHRPERMQAIAAKLSELDPDIVGFQESFIDRDRSILIDHLKRDSRLQYHQYYPSQVAGSGLLISSAYPLIEPRFHRYEASNPFYKIWEGDWWGGKGVALAKVTLPNNSGYLNVYNTHTQADYDHSDYENVRKDQLHNLVKFVRETRDHQTPALLVGDVNCTPGDVEFDDFERQGDLLRLMNQDSGLDHIFAVRDRRNSFTVLNTTKIQGQLQIENEVSDLSDHFGFMSTLLITPKPL